MALFAILFELMVLRKPDKFRTFVKAVNNNKHGDMTKNQMTFVLLQVGYFIWGFVGLFTSQWIPFAIIMILSIIPKGNYLFLRRVDAFLTLILLFFILINKFHLHINLI